MPGAITNADPVANRPIALPEASVARRGLTDPDPLGPDRLYNHVVGHALGSEAVWGRDLKDSGLTAALGAVADQQPDAIRRAIRYDRATGGYVVRLYDPTGRQVDIPVSRAEIADNIRRHGASLNDDVLPPLGYDPVKNASVIWPAVIETAYAKAHDGNWDNGLSQGYAAIQRDDSADAALHALTGNDGVHIGYVELPLLSKDASLDLLGTRINGALRAGSPVLIATSPERRSLLDILLGRAGAQDGLTDNQTMVVRDVYKDRNGVWQVEITNQAKLSSEPGDKFYIKVPLEKLVDTGGLKDFIVGAPPGTPPSPHGIWPPFGDGGPWPNGGRPTDPSILV